MQKQKVFRDPIHNYIKVDTPLVWELVNTAAFQRLNNIRQLGGSFQIFHGAVHTRFGHCLGVYAIAYDMIAQVTELRSALSYRQTLLFYCAALLHDLGHGPFSHASEAFLRVHHEKMTCRIILEDEEIRTILDNVDSEFANDVVLIIQKKFSNKLIVQLISSQVDVDRMDYLLRDAYYAGVPYGKYDRARILRVMKVSNNRIHFKESGICALEDFMLSRYHMRIQVYGNIKGQAFEVLLMLSTMRFIAIWEQKLLPNQRIYQKMYNFLTLNEKSTITDFLSFDDHLYIAVQKMLMEETDVTMVKLATDISHRRLPHVFSIADKLAFETIQAQLVKLRAEGDQRGFYAHIFEDIDGALYNYDTKDSISIYKKDGTIAPIEQCSTIIKALQQEQVKQNYHLFIVKDEGIEKDSDISTILAYLGIK
ncbi:MAG: HD domain-containing protein [Culicoidibacterales bacterium]